MAQLRVLSVFEYGSLHGGEQSWLAVAPALRQRDIELCAAAPPDSPLAVQLETVGVPCLPLEMERNREPDDAGLLISLQEIITQRRIELIHANSLSMSRRIGRLASDLPCATIGHLRDIIKLSRKAVADINRNQMLVAVSAATKRFHIQQGLAEARTRVVYNGVDLTLFQPRRDGRIRAEFAIPASAHVITSIGQIGMRKGLDVAAAAIHDLALRNESVHWLVVGERFSQKEEAVEFERQLHLTSAAIGTPRVHFLGVRSDIPNILAGSDVLLHSAKQEPLGRVLLEAAAAGTPIVATDVGGTSEILEDEVSALLIPANDVERTIAALDRLIANKSLRLALGKQARLRAVNRFNIPQAADSLAGCFRAALR